MISRIIWHTPRIRFTETVLDDGRRSNEVHIIGKGSISSQMRWSITSALLQDEFRYYPRHLFREDGTQGMVTSEYCFVETPDEQGNYVRYRVPVYDIEVHEMYMAPVVNADWNDFRKLGVFTQFMQCVNSLEGVRPGVVVLVIKEFENMKVGKTTRQKEKK